MRLQVAIVTLALILLHSFPAPLAVQSHDTVALSGVVRSQDEGNMEGVVVTARRDGAILSVSVVSDPTGHLPLPAHAPRTGFLQAHDPGGGLRPGGPGGRDGLG